MPNPIPSTEVGLIAFREAAGPGWVPQREYCELHNVTVQTARNRARRGEIETKKVSGHVFVRIERAK